MDRKITITDAHTTSIKTDHRNGKETEVPNKFEIRPVIDGYHNETLRNRPKFNKRHVTIFSDDLYYLVLHGDLKLNEWKVLMYLIATLDKENITFTNLDEISSNLGMHRNNVSKYLNCLIRRHLIIETKIQRRSRVGAQTLLFQVPLAQLNYNLCFNGEIGKYQSMKHDHPQITAVDGQTLLNPHAENERQKKLREQRERESLFPELYAEVEEVSPDPVSYDPETGEVFN